jgi:type I restriction enzyme S subunit
MQEEKRLVPQLRFSEFEGEWEKKTLFDISKQVAYGMNAAAKSYDGENKYLRITDIDESTRRFIPNPLSSPKGKIEKKYILKKGDIVFTRTGASVGKSYLYDEKDGKLLYAGFLIKFNIINSNPYFVFLQTFRESYRKWVQVYSMRSGQPGLNAEEYKSLIINIPQSKEQQKIANFLTAIDNRIQTLEKKKSGLEQYKKGVMQKIFKQELRFKDDTSTTLSASDGKAFPEWEEKKLGQTGNIKKGKQLNKEELTLSGTYPCQNGGISPSGYTEEYNTVGNTITISEGGNSCGYVNYMQSKFWCGGHCYSILELKKEVNALFLFQYLKFNEYGIMRLRVGSGLPNIQKKDLLMFEVKLPCIEEQTKIANFLSAIDRNIELVTKKIEHTKTYKKGLLQQMFV